MVSLSALGFKCSFAFCPGISPYHCSASFRFTSKVKKLSAHIHPACYFIGPRKKVPSGLKFTLHAQIGVPEALELLLDSSLNPKLAAFEVETIAKRLEEDIATFEKNDVHGRLLEVRTYLKP